MKLLLLYFIGVTWVQGLDNVQLPSLASIPASKADPSPNKDSGREGREGHEGREGNGGEINEDHEDKGERPDRSRGEDGLSNDGYGFGGHGPPPSFGGFGTGGPVYGGPPIGRPGFFGPGYGPPGFGRPGYGAPGFRVPGYGGQTYGGQGYSGPGVHGLHKYGPHLGGPGNPLLNEALYGGDKHGKIPIAGGDFSLGNQGVLGALGPIANTNLQGNFQPLKQFGFGGYGGLDNYGAQEINQYRYTQNRHPVDPNDLDNNGEPDHLTATKNKIDEYIAKQWLLGKRKLSVQVSYGNMPLEYQFLGQYHGFPNPVAGTPLAEKFGISSASNILKPVQGISAYGAGSSSFGQQGYGAGSFNYGQQSYGAGQSGYGMQQSYGANQQSFGDLGQLNYGAQQPYGSSEPNYEIIGLQSNGATLQNYGISSQQNYGASAQQNYGTAQQTYGTNSLSHGTNPQTYGMAQQSYGTDSQTYGTNSQTYGTVQQNYGMPQYDSSSTINYRTVDQPNYSTMNADQGSSAGQTNYAGTGTQPAKPVTTDYASNIASAYSAFNPNANNQAYTPS